MRLEASCIEEVRLVPEPVKAGRGVERYRGDLAYSKVPTEGDSTSEHVFSFQAAG